MFTTHEIFSKLPVHVAAELFTFLAEKEKGLLNATITTVCKQRNLRPIFIERKPKAERFAWIKDALSRKQNADVAAHLLQIWLVGKHAAMLCDFLDLLGIAHDEYGTIDELPAAPEKGKLTEAVNALIAKHDAGVVAVYLHAFQATDETGWSTLEELLAEDARLKL